MPAASAPAQRLPEVALTPQVRYAPIYNGMFNVNGTSFTAIWNLECRPRLVRAVILHPGASSYTLNYGAIAPTASARLGYDPINSSDAVDRTLWQRLSFANGGADVAPLDQNFSATPVYSVTIAAGSTARPSVTYSDWMVISPLARIDGGAGHLLLTRGFDASANIYYQSCTNGNGSNLPRNVRAYNTGNASSMSSPFVPNGSLNPAPAIWPYGLDVVADGYGATLMVVGDSIHSGSPDGYAGCYGHQAAALVSTTARPVHFESQAYPGRVSSDYLYNALQRIRGPMPPQIVVLPCWSRNDPFTQSGSDTTFRLSLAFAAECRKRGISVILTTAAPSFSSDVGGFNAATFAGYEAIRASNNAAVRQCASQGWSVLDIDAIWSDTRSPPGYKPAYAYTDGIHPTTAGGHAAAAPYLAPMLRKALGYY